MRKQPEDEKMRRGYKLGFVLLGLGMLILISYRCHELLLTFSSHYHSIVVPYVSDYSTFGIRNFQILFAVRRGGVISFIAGILICFATFIQGRKKQNDLREGGEGPAEVRNSER